MQNIPSPLNQAQPFFTVVILPDSQHYVERPGQEERIHCLEKQMEWIIQNKEKRNIRFVSHVGDYTHHRDNPKERSAFFERFLPLADHVPLGFCAGNHDILLSEADSLALPARGKQLNPAEFYQPNVQQIQENALQSLRTHSFWLEDRNFGQSNAQIFEALGQQYLFLHLEYGPSDETLLWANHILKAHAQIPAFLTTHMFVTPEEEMGVTRRESRLSTLQYNMAGQGDNAGVDILEKLILSCENVKWVFCGHYADERYLLIQAGNRTVHAMLSNYEWDKPYNGNSWLRLLTFYPTENRVQVDTYSPLFDAYRLREKSCFSLPID